MHDESKTTVWLQAMMPAAAYGPSPAVTTQYVCPMDLLASSGSLVPVAAVRKAVKTWAARWQFGVCIKADLLCF